MTSGVQIYNDSAETKLSPESKGLRALATYLFSAGSSGSVVVTDFTTNKGFISVILYGTQDTSSSYSFDNSTNTFSYTVDNAGGMQVTFFLTV